MRVVLLAVVASSLVSGVCFAQSPPAPVQAKQHHGDTGAERPVDNGPNTPQANAAYQGGGVVLQGAPGAPAPHVAPTPPGQVPANSVPHAQ